MQLRGIDNKLNEIKECIEKIKKEKPFFKQVILSIDEMDKFEK